MFPVELRHSFIALKQDQLIGPFSGLFVSGAVQAYDVPEVVLPSFVSAPETSFFDASDAVTLSLPLQHSVSGS